MIKFVTSTRAKWLSSFVDGVFNITEGHRELTRDLGEGIYVLWTRAKKKTEKPLVEFRKNDTIYIQESYAKGVFAQGSIVKKCSIEEAKEALKKTPYLSKETEKWGNLFVVKIRKINRIFLGNIKKLSLENRQNFTAGKKITTRGIFPQKLIDVTLTPDFVDKNIRAWRVASKALYTKILSLDEQLFNLFPEPKAKKVTRAAIETPKRAAEGKPARELKRVYGEIKRGTLVFVSRVQQYVNKIGSGKLILGLLLCIIVTTFFLINPYKTPQEESSRNAALVKVVEKGKYYLKAGLYDPAIVYFKDVIKKHSDIPHAYYYLGRSYDATGDLRSAEKNLKKTIDIDPSFGRAYYCLAIVREKQNRENDAVRYLEKVRAIKNAIPGSRYNKAVTFLAMGKVDLAVQAFTAVLDVSAQNEEALKKLLEAYVAKQKKTTTITIPNVQPEQKRVEQEMPEVEEKTITQTPEKPVEVKIEAPLPERKAHREQKLQKTGTKYAGIEDMQLFVVTSLGKKAIIFDENNPIEIVVTEKEHGYLDIRFREPKDLRNKYLQFDIKGTKGWTVEVILKDQKTKRSPDIYVCRLSDTWRVATVNFQESAYDLNLDQLKQIKIKLLPPQAPVQQKAVMYIKGIEIR